MQVEFYQNILYVIPGCKMADVQMLGQTFGGEPFCQQFQHLDLPWGKSGGGLSGHGGWRRRISIGCSFCRNAFGRQSVRIKTGQEVIESEH
ncbi:MAG: hypothetical protein H6Q07_2316, partial [Acidobacteria bacterium]|nr:hypothetical protein [Acidobacteriota bacterium]